MLIDQTDFSSWNRTYRLKFINSISGYKAVHLVGTQSKTEKTNLAIFNSVVHITSNPPQLGFIMRPLTVKRDTYTNILETGFFTFNHVHKSFLKQAHYTSANFKKEQSEFDACNLGEDYISNFPAPFVKESTVKVGLKLIEDVPIASNGSRLIIGEIQMIHIEDDYVEPDGQLDFEKAHDVVVTGLNQYSSVRKFVNHPYARVEELPDFYAKQRPDNVVFDDTSQTYNANVLPYGTNIGAPSINPVGVSTWKNSSIASFNHLFNEKIDTIKKEYQNLIDEYQINDLLYRSSMGFEPIVGKVYHLYAKENRDEHFLSLIPPGSWKKEYLGSFKLDGNKVWQKLTLNETENER